MIEKERSLEIHLPDAGTRRLHAAALAIHEAGHTLRYG
jgi:hypothetical protein